MSEKPNQDILSQADLDQLLYINEFIGQDHHDALIRELKHAILDSGKLETMQWEVLRENLRQIEELIPHIDFIIKLKRERQGADKLGRLAETMKRPDKPSR